MITLTLLHPDIPQNTGAILRLCACLEIPLQIIEPCGFIIGDKRYKRAVMDYGLEENITRFSSWEDFLIKKRENKERLILFTTSAIDSFHNFNFRLGDQLIFGSESSGAPKEVHETVDNRLKIPISSNLRSINLAQCAAIAASEALRQIDGFPKN